MYDPSNIVIPRRIAAAASALVLLLACDSGSNPVAPEGTILSVQANPTQIPVTGTSAITVLMLHTSGRPALAGTEVRLRTTLGTIEDLVYTDDKGIARATLRADGREGEAKVTASSGTVTAEAEPVKIGFDNAAALKASFEAVVTESLTVFFDDLSEGEPTSWHWSFGDGDSSTEREPTHEYRAAGTYAVSLTVRDADEEDSARKIVRVPASQTEKPVADFTAAVDDLKVTFTDTSTGGPPAEWEWDFGDGHGSAAQNPVHAYDEAGNYSVTLVVSNAAGSSSKSKPVTVPISTAPVADFSAREVDDFTILFTDGSTGGTPTTWEWEFGDGGTSTLQNPSHRYSASGVYTVVLTVGNPAGSSTKSAPIEVFGPLSADFGFRTSGLTALFTDASLGKPDERAWDFGDGNQSSQTNPTHTYAEAGSYVVTLTVTRDKQTTGRSTSIVRRTVTVE